jgi:hypothetical protein
LKPIESEPGTLEDQLESVWRLLGDDKLGALAATGTRELLRPSSDRAMIVRDMVLLPGAPETQYHPRALAIGLENGASLLFDTDRLTWLAWWRGGFLSRTKSGRLWEWHPEGTRLWTASGRQAPVVFVSADRSLHAPAEVRERYGPFRAVEFVGRGVRLEYGLFVSGGVDQVNVMEEIQPLHAGWQRVVRVSGVPAGLRPALVDEAPLQAKRDTSGASWIVGTDRLTVGYTGTAPIEASSGPRVWLLEPVPEAGYSGRAEIRIEPAN